VARRKRKNPWTSASEVILWLLFVLLLIPVGFAGYAVGHYTSIGKPPTKVTVTVGTMPATTTSAMTTTTAATTTSASGPGAAAIAAGKVVFNDASNNCAGCHTFVPAGSSGTVGPNLDTAPAMDAKDAGMALPAFIKESIVNPDAYIAKGYTAGLMPTNFGTTLTSTQVNNLVAFILSGTQK
jgi:mono/diheme cytochrome c family protein